jgi:formylglycine-generating enzyme required for sulfatase activity
VLRGGAFLHDEGSVRCAYRNGGDPSYWLNIRGFRLVVGPRETGPA